MISVTNLYFSDDAEARFSSSEEADVIFRDVFQFRSCCQRHNCVGKGEKSARNGEKFGLLAETPSWLMDQKSARNSDSGPRQRS